MGEYSDSLFCMRLRGEGSGDLGPLWPHFLLQARLQRFGKWTSRQ